MNEGDFRMSVLDVLMPNVRGIQPQDFRPTFGRTFRDEPPARAPRPAPPPGPPVDPIEALADARALLARLQADLGKVTKELDDEAPMMTNPAVASMYHGHDVLREKADAVESLLSGGTVGEFQPRRDLQREVDTLKEAIERQGRIVSQLTLSAAPAIYARDWEKKHKKALKRLAVALLELRDAHEAELEVAREALRAGCFPNGGGSFSMFAMRPSIRLLNPPALKTLLQSLRGVQKPEDML
jgi:hypothetical protein